VEIARERFEDGLWVVALFKEAGLAASNGEVRRLIRGGGCYVDDKRVTDDARVITCTEVADGQLTIRAGKKNRRRVILV
jgi:tyrosyl-tRNA synthetase